MQTLNDSLADKILRCPITHTPLRKLSSAQISEINSRIDRGEIYHYDGSAIRKSLEQGLISQDGAYAYPIVQNVITLLPNLALELKSCCQPKPNLQKLKRMVQDYYDQIGWLIGEKGEYVDVEQFADTRTVVHKYYSKCGLRMHSYLKPKGKYILDVGSGPAKDRFGGGYSKRICVDLSFRALQEAQKHLGDKGLYLLADATNLPLQSASLDAAVSLHAIYHIPAEEQKTALEEMHRVLKSRSSAIVVYSWSHSALLMNIFHFPINCFLALRKRFKRIYKFITGKSDKIGSTPPGKTGSSAGPQLYFHAHDFQYFKKNNWTFDLEIAVWSSLSIQFMRTYIHKLFLGELILRGIFWLEDRFPRFFRQWGQYPLLVIRKQ
jgi:ubiquinone/menaquinone biosynthesis C-methylase UbiE/uncharacterized protein YbaR (Trm112 family)